MLQFGNLAYYTREKKYIQKCFLELVTVEVALDCSLALKIAGLLANLTM